MKKSLALIVFAFFLSIPAFAQTTQIPAISPVPTSAFDGTIVGLGLQATQLTYGDKRLVNFTPIGPCRLVNTFTDSHFPTTYFNNGEIRTYALSEGGCAGQIPDAATDVAVKVTTFGVTNAPTAWDSPGGRVLFTTPSSPTNSGGVMLDGRLPGFAYFVAGEVLYNRGLVQLRTVPQEFSAVNGLGIQVVDGETQIIVDVLGYATPATGTAATSSNYMTWMGAWSSTASYAVGDVVSAPNGTWVKTAAGWDLVSDGTVKLGLKNCLSSSKDVPSLASCLAPYLQ